MLYEASYPPLLQGVSQQHQDLRKPGQLTEQINMLSDPVTGLRRRPGVAFVRALGSPITGTPYDPSLFVDVIDTGGSRVLLWIDTKQGLVELLNPKTYDRIAFWSTNYLRTLRSHVRTAFVGDSVYIANTLALPNAQRGSTGRVERPVGTTGFAYIPSGAFSRTFHILMQSSTGGYTATITTPSGQGTNDAAAATPERIASDLFNLLVGKVPGVTMARRGAYIYFQSDNGIVINTDTGPTHMITSGNGRVPSTSQLPQILPPAAEGMVVAVGLGRAPQYYRYDSDKSAWVETGRPGGVSTISNVPLRLYKEGTEWKLDQEPWEGRYAGDDDSNPDMKWVTGTITGMASYQGRLCIMSGNYIAFSAAGNPKRWYRSTVTELLDSDPIEIGASGQSSAEYVWGVQYQRDLLLFSAQHQAVVPSTGAAISPRTATVVPTSSYGVDTWVPPRPMGKTLMYPRPVAPGYTGWMEMIPSQYTDSQYLSEDATPHLPRYFQGRCHAWTVSNSIPMAAAVCTTTPHLVHVYEYAWDGDERVQSAWHTWQFHWAVDALYFLDGVLHLVFWKDGLRVVGTIDPRGSADVVRNTYPFLDLHFKETLYGGQSVNFPRWMSTLLPDNIEIGDALGRTYADKSNANWGMPIPAEPGQDSFDSTQLLIEAWTGFKFKSHFIPPRPIILDQDGNPVHSRTSTILKYELHLHRSYKQYVTFYRGIPSTEPRQRLFIQPVLAPVWDNWNLNLGTSWVQPEAYCTVPARVKTDDHYIKIESDSIYELNVLGLGFAIQYNPKIQRG